MQKWYLVIIKKAQISECKYEHISSTSQYFCVKPTLTPNPLPPNPKL